MVMHTKSSLRMQKVREAAAANAGRKREAIKTEFNRIYEAAPRGKHVTIDLESIYEELAKAFFISKATVTKIIKSP